MDEYLEPLGLSISRTLDVETLHKEDIWEMYEVLRAAFIEVHEFNAQREFPKEGIECRLGECLAKIHGTALDHNKMRQDRERLKREYGEPASSKLRRLRDYICSIAPDLMHDDPGAFSNW